MLGFVFKAQAPPPPLPPYPMCRILAMPPPWSELTVFFFFFCGTVFLPSEGLAGRGVDMVVPCLRRWFRKASLLMSESPREMHYTLSVGLGTTIFFFLSLTFPSIVQYPLKPRMLPPNCLGAALLLSGLLSMCSLLCHALGLFTEPLVCH